MRFLLDEAFPPAAATLLRDQFDHDAVHVSDVGLTGADDADVARYARSEGRAMFTENVVDYAGEPDLVLVCVLKRKLPLGGAQAAALAEVLDDWAQHNPRPYVGQHWPGSICGGRRLRPRQSPARTSHYWLPAGGPPR